MGYDVIYKEEQLAKQGTFIKHLLIIELKSSISKKYLILRPPYLWFACLITKINTIFVIKQTNILY